MSKDLKELNSYPARACGEPSVLLSTSKPPTNPSKSSQYLPLLTTTLTLPEPSSLTGSCFLNSSLSLSQVYSQCSSQKDPGKKQTTSPQCPKPPMVPAHPV